MKIDRSRLCFYSSMYKGESSAAKIISLASRLGLGGVELMSFCDELKQPDIKAAMELSRLAKEGGLSLPCFSVGVDIISEGEAAMKRLFGYAEICSELGIPYLHHTVALDYRSGGLNPTERKKRFDIGSEYAIRLSEYAERLGVRTLIEDQGFVFNGADACLALSELSEGKIGIVADFGNSLFVDEVPVEFIEKMGSRICHAHIKDYLYTTDYTDGSMKTQGGKYLTDIEIGMGDVDIDGSLTALEKIGYTGAFSLEFGPSATEEEAIRTVSRLAY